jgi:hypothetical protein
VNPAQAENPGASPALTSRLVWRRPGNSRDGGKDIWPVI